MFAHTVDPSKKTEFGSHFSEEDRRTRHRPRLDHDCGVVDPAPSEVSFRTGLSGSDATSTPTPRTWGRKIQGKPGLETTSSSIKIALTNKLLDEQTNGNATLESLKIPLGEDFSLDWEVNHWPLFSDCQPRLPCIHTVVQHRLPERFFSSDLMEKFPLNLGWKKSLLNSLDLSKDGASPEGSPLGNTFLIQLDCPSVQEFRLEVLKGQTGDPLSVVDVGPSEGQSLASPSDLPHEPNPRMPEC